MNRRRGRLIFALIVLGTLVLAGIPLSAQEQKVVLAFFENNSGDLRLVNEDGSEEKFGEELAFGDDVPILWTLVTGDSDSAELLLEPNGTIIKVAENTNFTVESLQGLDGAYSNTFNLGFGKFRTIAAMVSGNERYDFKGMATTCGVRGTDFGMQRQIVGTTEVEEAFVFDGEVAYTKHATGETILLTANQYADAQNPVFQPLEMPSTKSEGLLNELDFKQLKAVGASQVGEAAAAEEALGVEEAAKEAEEAVEEVKEPSGWEFLSFDVGALTVGDDTYAKAVLTPSLTIGKFTAGFYLPLIYGTDVFDTGDWYKPKGNNEWSFGTDQGGEIGAVLRDLAIDLALKIEYIQWGDPNDSFYLRVGSIHNVTLGHGLVMRDYANDIDFPAIRRLGVSIKADFDNAGFQTVLNDLTEPEIFGVRFYARPAAPAFPMAIGVSSTVDLDPAGDLPDAESIGNPVLLTLGFDLDYPFVNNESSSFILFADFAGMIPYFRNSGSAPYDGVSAGPGWDSLISFSPFAFRNVGTAVGAFGYFGPVDWRLEWRLSKGAFKVQMIDRLYERTRANFARKAAEYAHDPTGSDLDALVMGIYGEIGYTMEKVFAVELGYLFPFSTSGGSSWDEEDYLHLGATLFKGAIGGFPIGASISYDRNYFVPMLFYGETEDGRELSFFDEFTVVQASLIYGASDNIDIMLLMTMTATRDSEGKVEYESDLTPKVSTTFTIETHVQF